MTTTAVRALVSPLVSISAHASRPLAAGSVRLTGGLWHDRQAVNRAVTLRKGLENLQAQGNFENFRNVVAGSGRHGHAEAIDGDVKNFVDSDVYKWLEAVGWESARGPLEPEIEACAEEAISAIVAAQDADGYLNTWYQTQDRATRFSNLAFGHEMYCLGHLIQAGIAFARARGDDRLLRVGRRFADLVVERFGEDGEVAVCGHPEIEMALVELSRETGDSVYAEQARLFVDRRGRGLLGEGRFGSSYYQDRVPFRDLSNVEGHAVRAVYLGAGAVDVAVESQDDELLDAASRQWDAMVASKTHLTGSVGSRYHGESFGDPYELSPDAAYCETCAAIGVMMWSWRLLLATRRSEYADLVERAAYNGALVGLSLDGTRFNYVNPLHVRTSHPRQEWFEIACCPPNLMRTLASIEQYVASEDDGAVYLHQFADAEIDGGLGRRLRVETRYPADGAVRVQVTGTGEQPWTLALRVPGWVDGPVLATLDGSPLAVEPDASGYVAVERSWSVGDVLEVRFPMGPRLTVGGPAIDGVRGAVAVERGPMVYCLEAPSAGGSLDEFLVDPTAVPRDGDATVAGLPEVVLPARQSPQPKLAWPYLRPGAATPASGEPADLRLTPYFAWGNGPEGPMRVWLRTV